MRDDEVAHVFHPDPVPVDPDVSQREEDAREVRHLFARYAGHDRAPLSVIAVLLGQSPRSAGRFGPHGGRLLAEAQSGRLRVAESLRRTGGTDPAVRHNPLTCPVERSALCDWLVRHGTAADRASLAGRWAGVTSGDAA